MIRPAECWHPDAILVAASCWTGTPGQEPGRYAVTVCPDCGRFVVAGHVANHHYEVCFELASDEVVAAAGQYQKGLAES